MGSVVTDQTSGQSAPVSSPISLQGIVPPLVTPLAARDELDHAGLQRLLDHVIDGGVAAVFILGTTGEAPSLSYRLRREMIAESVRIVDGRVPVLVGVTDTAYVETVTLAEYAAECGADAAVLTIEFKINLMAPARGPLLRFEGRVTKAGRTISVVDGRALQRNDDGADDTLIATMTATVMTVLGRGIRG